MVSSPRAWTFDKTVLALWFPRPEMSILSWKAEVSTSLLGLHHFPNKIVSIEVGVLQYEASCWDIIVYFCMFKSQLPFWQYTTAILLFRLYLCKCIQHEVFFQNHDMGLRSLHLKPELNNSAMRRTWNTFVFNPKKSSTTCRRQHWGRCQNMFHRSCQKNRCWSQGARKWRPPHWEVGHLSRINSHSCAQPHTLLSWWHSG